ncbi:hypothetical protein BGX23_006227 [Mortierella sp. AD031]|nr:hypothetical protein BGX23_006227 [Mortierella sp. AD031]
MGQLGMKHSQGWTQQVSRVSPGQVSKVKLKNVSSSPVGYKFKTNAPMKYSVKPVLGVLAPDESVKIFVRCDNWVSPQDRFLLQSIILTDDEKKTLDSRTWKSLDPKRFIECYIPCVSVSALTLRDPEDDAGSLSSSSAASSSTTISPPLQAIDLTRLPPPRSRQQVFERWQYSESMRPTVSMGGVGKRLSNSSTTSTSPGVYPTLFTSKNSMDYYFPSSPTTPTGSDSSAWSSKRNSFSSTSTVVQSPIITSTIVEEPVSMLDGTSVYHVKSTGSTSSSSANNREVPGKLVVAKGHALRTQSWIQILWEPSLTPESINHPMAKTGSNGYREYEGQVAQRYVQDAYL